MMQESTDVAMQHKRVRLAVAFAVSACAQLPDMPQKPVAKDISRYETAHSLSADGGKQGSTASAWPTDQWWLSYNDPQLNALIGEALQDEPTLAAAQARLHNAEASAQVAGAALLPEVSADGSVQKKKQSYNNGIPSDFVPHGWRPYGSAELNFSYEIDFWGKNRAALAAATSELDAARADAAQARMVLSASIAAAYADLARLFAERDSAQAALQVRTQSAQLFRERFANGLETQAGVKQAESKQQSAQADLLALDESIALERNQIAALMGAGPDRGLRIAPPAVDLTQPAGMPANLGLGLLGRRPDVVIARLRVEAAAKRIDVARAGFYPDITLGASVGFQSLGLNMLTNAASLAGNFGPAITLPIFNGGRLRGELRGARATYDEAVANYDETLTKALHDVADVAASERALADRLQATQAAYDDAAQAHQVALDRYRAGLAGYLEVLNAADTMTSAQRQLADIRSRTFSLDVALVRALGGGYQASTPAATDAAHPNKQS
ncbi:MULTISPECIES: efflux transporter outer membrane subunit [Paraburkholderia]|uniref:efflux transporter outer membrane subunit n=1 Tax=Paraburkholderia TaxID=1822464 RepID=UPI000371B871|nr:MULTISPECIES: efflux transporter outer membrane subunit [Paraburkholderia]MDH6148227.1 NodT family efflux transporter outer membrane factor (OMF) lipoprotein [Paraburkholderia sp. WSM4179]